MKDDEEATGRVVGKGDGRRVGASDVGRRVGARDVGHRVGASDVGHRVGRGEGLGQCRGRGRVIIVPAPSATHGSRTVLGPAPKLHQKRIVAAAVPPARAVLSATASARRWWAWTTLYVAGRHSSTCSESTGWSRRILILVCIMV